MRYLMLAMTAISLGFGTPAAAQFLYSTYNGTVVHATDSTVVARNPDGTTATFSGGDIPAYSFKVGDPFPIDFVFGQPGPAQIANAACGGRFSLNFNGGGPCQLSTTIRTPAGQVGFGGFGGDNPGGVTGVDIVRNPSTGAYSVDIPTGNIAFAYVPIQPYLYDSKARTLSLTPKVFCGDANCASAGRASGTIDALSLGLIPILGDYGTFRPGLNLGYDAGSAGNLGLSGMFTPPSTTPYAGGPTSVPEPGMMGLFVLGAAVLCLSPRRRNSAAR